MCFQNPYQKRTAGSLLAISCFALVLLSGCVKTSMEEVFNLGDTPKIESQLESQPVSVWTDDFEQAMIEAKSTGKYVIADFTGSDWCRWCVRLEKEVFETAPFQEWSVKNAILLKVDFPRNTPQSSRVKLQNKKLAQKYEKEIKGYPTILVLDPEGNVVARTGYVKGGPKAWLAELESQLMESEDNGLPPKKGG